MLFLALMIIIQLNIFATRTPSLWWRFTASTAPRPSVFLMLPVGGVLVAATFVAVYWPEEVQPDGGRGVLIGAGECTLALPSWVRAHVCLVWDTQSCLVIHKAPCVSQACLWFCNQYHASRQRLSDAVADVSTPCDIQADQASNLAVKG